MSVSTGSIESLVVEYFIPLRDTSFSFLRSLDLSFRCLAFNSSANVFILTVKSSIVLCTSLLVLSLNNFKRSPKGQPDKNN